MRLTPLFGYADTGIPADARANADYQSKMLANLQTMRENERSRIDRQRTEKQRETLMAPVDGPEDLPKGAPAPMSAGMPAPAAAPAPAQANTGSFAASAPVSDARRAQYTNANVTPATTPNQSDAESARLSRAPRGKPGVLDQVAAVTTMPGALAMEPAAQQQRYAELKAKNPSKSSGGNESPAEAKRLLDKPVPAATPGARTKRGEQYATAKTPYDATITKAATDAGLDPEVFKRLIGSESSFRPDPPVVVGANGQRHLGIAQISDLHGMSDADRRNPDIALPFAAKLFAKYLKESDGDYNEALLRYKGATSAKGRESMRGPIEDILSGTRYLGGQQPTQTSAAPQTQTPGAAPAPQAQAPAAATPPMQFTPEQVNQLAVATDQEMRMINMKLAEVNRQLSVAPTAADAVRLRTQANDLRFGAYGAQLKNAFVQGISGNQDAIGQLANAAGVQYAQTPQGFVAVRLDPAKGQYVAVTEPAPMHVFVRQMYDEASGAAAKAREAQNAAQAKVNADISLERVRNEGAMAKAYLEGNITLRNKLAEARINENDIEGITFSPDGSGRALIRTKRGVIQYNPEQDMGDGVPVPAGLSNLPIPQ
jgi:hypothetical protein